MFLILLIHKCTTTLRSEWPFIIIIIKCTTTYMAVRCRQIQNQPPDFPSFMLWTPIYDEINDEDDVDVAYLLFAIFYRALLSQVVGARSP